MINFLHNTLTFRHGVHPAEFKNLSSHRAIERIPYADEYTLPLNQHIGAPSEAIVRKGEYVRKGQKIAKAVGFVSVSLHSPVDGTISETGLVDSPKGELVKGIKIKTDPYSQQVLKEEKIDIEDLEASEFISYIQDAGIVGLGGAAFPAHVKFSIPEGKKCKYLMLNGCECEPFLTADHRTMVEHAESIINGTNILSKYLEPERIIIAIESNKADAVKVFQEMVTSNTLPIEVIELQTKYPQGAEKMMISAILEKEVPSGKLPIDLGVLVCNVGTIKAVSDFFSTGMPLIERIVTVSGTALNRPSNVLVPIGTSMRDLIEFCGGMKNNIARMVLGGPMMGAVQKTLDVPVVKGTSGILIMGTEEVRDIKEYNCIRCGQCINACPLFLNPARMGVLAKKGLWDEMMDYNVLDCFECGSCSYVCPSGIPLVQSFRVAKSILKEKMARENVK